MTQVKNQNFYTPDSENGSREICLFPRMTWVENFLWLDFSFNENFGYAMEITVLCHEGNKIWCLVGSLPFLKYIYEYQNFCLKIILPPTSLWHIEVILKYFKNKAAKITS